MTDELLTAIRRIDELGKEEHYWLLRLREAQRFGQTSSWQACVANLLDVQTRRLETMHDYLHAAIADDALCSRAAG